MNAAPEGPDGFNAAARTLPTLQVKMGIRISLLMKPQSSPYSISLVSVDIEAP